MTPVATVTVGEVRCTPTLDGIDQPSLGEGTRVAGDGLGNPFSLGEQVAGDGLEIPSEIRVRRVGDLSSSLGRERQTVRNWPIGGS